MERLLGITDDANQKIVYQTQYGQITLNLRYDEICLSWYANIGWKKFSVENRLIRCDLNWLNQYRRLLGWGIKVECEDPAQDVINRDDFKTGKAKLYLLTEDEVDYITNIKYRYNSELLEEELYGND